MNQIIYYSLTPQDAWFFRDGRPYNKTESNQADAMSQFPPSPRTIAGALRAALARANGWEKGPTWDCSLNPVIGNGPDDLGALKFTGPFLMKNRLPFYPAPLHLLGKTEEENEEKTKEKIWNPITLLRPANEKTLTDKGYIHLPETDGNLSVKGLKPAEKRWLSKTGYQYILAGNLPGAEDLKAADSLWKIERRVGLQRNPSTLQTEEGALYSPAFVRLCKETSLGFGLSMDATKMSAGFIAVLPALFPLGGESRLALCEELDTVDILPSCPELTAGGNLVRFIVTALTPVPAQREENITALLGIDGVVGVSACVGRPVFFGGWNSIKREPLPLEPFYPPGSVWFFEAPEAALPQILALHGQWIGKKRLSAYGFGQVAIGCWPKKDNN
ncbi:type III-B CRISPR module-associated Cmr3 family protein [uncultured Desulfobacter sp.]|uniref:type III-B CRISPR module-associated Cmr3 family protein n=1 Tax=uncultured Desulfobacter sp. TaxID=240139 RepID=UPI002AABEE51|nr:type III-B CRISPR module-associated Cmr3 family protein [uncultured Desulfobacter sp.]